MRKLNSNELQHVYGGWGSECGSQARSQSHGHGSHAKSASKAKSNSCGSKAKSASYSQNKCY